MFKFFPHPLHSSPFLSRTHSGGTFSNSHVVPSLHVFTYIYSLLIEKDICDCRNVSIKLSCVCVSLLPENFIFSVRVSSFFSYFLCYVLNLSVIFLVTSSLFIGKELSSFNIKILNFYVLSLRYSKWLGKKT